MAAAGRHRRPGTCSGPPYDPPSVQGDGRNMLRPYGLTCAYPSEFRERVGVGLSSLAERCGTGG